MDNRAEIRIALEKRSLPIPYGRSKREDGENFGYRSILKDPKVIDQIPELNEEVGMKEFFRRLNDSKGVFESVRMVHWFNRADARFERSLAFGFVFRDRRLFSGYSNCFMFAGNLLDQICAGRILCDVPFLIEIQPATFLEEHVDGWLMDLYVSGVGDSEDSARRRLDNVLESLTPFFQTGDMQ
jgi:hypothetical protein